MRGEINTNLGRGNEQEVVAAPRNAWVGKSDF